MVTILFVALAGDAVRNTVGVTPWACAVVASGLWGVAVMWTHRVSWREFPVPLLVLIAWWCVSPAWSPYPVTALTMLIPVAIATTVGVGMVTAVPLDEFIRRGAVTLRIILVVSVLFEIGVAIARHPVYPVGFTPRPDTPIESAWSRGNFFDLDERIQGIVGNANLLGTLALLLLIVGTWRMFASRSWKNVSAWDTLLALFLVVRTASATVTVMILGLAVVIAITAMARRPGRAWRFAVLASLGVLLIGAVTVAMRWDWFAALLGKSPDLTHRVDIWTAVLNRVAEQPFVGFGFVGWWPNWDPWFAILTVNGLPVGQAHNVWIDVLLQTGALGVALFALALGSTLVSLWRGFRESARSVATVPFLIMSALAIQSATESRLLHEWGLMTLVGFALVALRIQRGLTSPR